MTDYVGGIPVYTGTQDVTTSNNSSSNDNPYGMDFMQLLLLEMQNQDPMEPMDNKQMMAQFAQLTTVQELQKISAAMESLTEFSQINNAAGFVGKSVEGFYGDETLEGVVESVEITEDGVTLMLQDQDTGIPMSNVTRIFMSSETETE